MKAKLHNDSLFKGRQITVIPKRKNVPGHGPAGLGGGFNKKNPASHLLNVMAMMFGGRGGGPRGGGRGGFRGGPPGGPGGAGRGGPSGQQQK